jgi:SAM-dependent methyltransferase
VPGNAAHAEGSAQMEHAPSGPCWICGGTELDRVWQDPLDLSELPRLGPLAHANHAPTWVVRCRACGFGQPEYLPAADYFDRLYSIEWTPESLDREFDVGTKDLIFNEVQKGLEKRRAAGLPRSVLDIGTHVGRFVYLARAAGWEAEGAEFNPVTATYAARRTGAPIHQGRAQDLVDQGRRFTAITFNDVLEHIPRPIPVVAQVRALLHPGGILAVKVPHGPMQRVKEGLKRSVLRMRRRTGVGVHYVHVNHFTVESLRRCLEEAGYSDIQILVGAPDFVPASYAGRTPGEACSAGLRQATYRAARLIPGGVRSPLSLNLQAFAVNREPSL